MKIDAKVRGRPRGAAKRIDGVETRQVDQCRQDAAMRRPDHGVGDDLVPPRHFEDQFPLGQIDNVETEPAVKRRNVEHLSQFGEFGFRGALGHLAPLAAWVRIRKSAIAAPKTSFWLPTTMCVASAMSL